MARPGTVTILAVLLLGTLPLLVTRPAPLLDWPNHVARMHVLPGLLRGDAFWTHYYRFVGFMVPDAALDLVVLGLGHAGVPTGVAAQSFLVATYLVFVAGFCALARALGALAPVKVAFVILLFYCNALFWGLVNYILGVGLMLGLLALWLGSRPHGEAGRLAARTVAAPDTAWRCWRRLLIAGAGGAVLLFTHVVAAVGWIVVLGCFDLCRLLASREPAWQRFLGSMSWLVALVTVAVLLHALPGEAGHDFSIHYAGVGIGGFIAHKLKLFAEVLLGGSPLQDAVSAAALLFCAAVAASARPRLAPAPALAAAALVVVTLAAPERIGAGSVLDVRLAILPLLLLAAGLRIQPGRWAVSAVSAAVLARTLVLAVQWHAAGLVFRDFRQQAAQLPAGSVMMLAYGIRLPALSWQQVWSPPIASIATQAVFREMFVPALFANPAQQPIALRAAYRLLPAPWNMTDSAHLHATAASLAALCVKHDFSGVYVTVLYPGGFLPSQVGAALLHAQRDFLILDACRLPR